MDFKHMSTAQTLKQDPSGLEQGQPEPHRGRPDGFGDWIYWLVTRLWFGFGISAIFAVIAVMSVGEYRESSHSRDYSVAIVPAVGAVSFLAIGFAARKVRRGPTRKNSVHQ